MCFDEWWVHGGIGTNAAQYDARVCRQSLRKQSRNISNCHKVDRDNHREREQIALANQQTCEMCCDK